ncbi:unnamed protein product [Enterobius vermicularis]|uniref:F-BAR domain-containing protein n=1 Tax=Enterobius vermicularis TaxID=51028 RepID=A0A0N4VLU5_ENTVE|nr:unnamed protein product [Enterobius vermicularis]
MNGRRSGPTTADRYCSPPITATSPNRNEMQNRKLLFPFPISFNYTVSQHLTAVFYGRRTTSASKLSQIFGSNSERTSTSSLQSGLQDLGATSKLATKIAESQLRGADLLERWARDSQNAAIDDVMHQTSQLFRMFSEKQLQFAKDYDHFLKQLHKIADAEKLVHDAEKKLQFLEDREKKLKREIQKAERVLNETRAEMEVVKMFRFRHGMQGIADSYRAFGKNCQAIFDCHREITELVPAVANEDVRRMVYDGVPITRERVENLRRFLIQVICAELTITINRSLEPETAAFYPPARRRSEPIRSRARISQGTPPPPYTPSAPNEEQMIPVFSSSAVKHQY